MKTATVRELRNDYARLLRRVEAGEQIVITRRGKSVARLVPERQQPHKKVDWTKSAAFRWDRRGERVLTANESAEAIQASRGRWW